MRLVILDRDGVINEDSDAFIKNPAQWHPIEGSLEAIARLKHSGCKVVVASNQSGLARGLFDYDALFAIHDKMARMLRDLGAHIDGIFFCPHAPDAGCRCRKPKPGLLEDIARRMGRTVDDCPFIGDSLSDLEAARAAGARPLLVRSKKLVEHHAPILHGVPVYENLSQAVASLLSGKHHRVTRG